MRWLRRWWRPRKELLLCPASAYHVDELGPLADELADRGHRVRFLVQRKRLESVADALSAHDFPVEEFRKKELPTDLVTRRSAGLVSMKDWGAHRALFEASKTAGVPTFAKVEGAQDFHDADVPWDRGPYTTTDVVLCQGHNDYEHTSGTRHIVGNTRLERIWLAPPRERAGQLVVLNLNFTWGVLEEARGHWLATAREGCRLAGLPYAISRHPDETSQPDDPNVSDEPMRELLKRAAILVSRFSTVPFEAMARGVPFVYHNPHDEGAGTFQEPRGAFEVSTSAAELADALEASLAWTDRYRERCADFFLRQVDVDPERPSEERTAAVIETTL